MKRRLTRLLFAAGVAWYVVGGFPNIALSATDGASMIFLNQGEAESDMTIACKIPANAREYPCDTVDPAAEVKATVNQVANYLATDPDCAGFRFSTGDGIGGNPSDHWTLDVDASVGDHSRVLRWFLFPPGSGAGTPRAWGDNKPEELAHLVCKIASEKGAVRVGSP